MGAPKQKWTAEEEQALRSGVEKYGPGKWRAIQKDPKFAPYLTQRSNVDLKDKWRNMSVAAGAVVVSKEKRSVGVSTSSNREGRAAAAAAREAIREAESSEEVGLSVGRSKRDAVEVKENKEVIARTVGERKPKGGSVAEMKEKSVHASGDPSSSPTEPPGAAITRASQKRPRSDTLTPTQHTTSSSPPEGNAASSSEEQNQKQKKKKGKEREGESRRIVAVEKFPEESGTDAIELAKCRVKTAEEAARYAAKAVAEAELAAAAAEVAAREAELAEAEAEAAEAAAEAAVAAVRPPKKRNSGEGKEKV